MILEMTCTQDLNSILYTVKSILNIIMIITPILAIISLIILLFKLTMNPEEKKLIKNLENAMKALIIIFFIPLLINISMSLAGSKTNISNCYNNATKPTLSSNHTKINEDDETTIYNDNDYKVGGVKQLDFSCKSKHIKGQFSCKTIHIVERHLNDFNYYTFNSVIASHGNFKNYTKTVGGIFEDYFDKQLDVQSAYELQLASEYVFGWLYMYGVDYFNGKNYWERPDRMYCKWGGSCMGYEDLAKAEEENRLDTFNFPVGTTDAFYPGDMRYEDHGGPNVSQFDKEISSTEPNITTNCSSTVDMIYYKAGIFGTDRCKIKSSGDYTNQAKYYKVVDDFKDLQIGDIIHFFSAPVDSSNPSTWREWKHVAFVGEVNKKKETFTIYDGGSILMTARNYKYTISTKKTTKTLSGWPGWGAIHLVDLK